MIERKKEMLSLMENFRDMPDRLLKYIEILLEGEDATSHCYQDTMSFRRLGIKLVNRCNLKCKWCYRGDSANKDLVNSKDLSVETLRKFVENTKGKFRLVHFGGLGEPTLHRNLSEVIGLAGKLSDNVKLTTNGTLLSPELIAKMIAAGLTHLEVSIDGFTDEDNKEWRGSDLKKLVRNIVHISNNTNLILQINSVLSCLNYNSLMNMVEMLKDAKNIDTFHTIPLFMTEQMRNEGIERVPDNEYIKLLRKIEADIKKYNLKWKLSPPPEGVSLDPTIEMKRKRNICFTCFEDPSIGTDGYLCACGRIGFAPLADATQGFEKAWNHPKMLEFRKNMLRGKYPEFCGNLCYLKEKKAR